MREKITPEALIDLIGELGREVHNLIDDCETSGDVGQETHTITTEGLQKVSAILDRIDALPFEEPGYILGPGAMLQAAFKQTLLAERDALRAACNQARLAFAGYVSAQSAINMLDALNLDAN